MLVGDGEVHAALVLHRVEHLVVERVGRPRLQEHVCAAGLDHLVVGLRRLGDLDLQGLDVRRAAGEM